MFIERFNRTYRTEILDFYLFRTLNEAREITKRWLVEYNSEQPHESLNNLTIAEKTRNLKKCVELKQVCLHLIIHTWKLSLKNSVKLLNKKYCTIFMFGYNAITNNRLIDLLAFRCADV